MQETMWRTYEKVAAYLFNPHREHFGLERVEGKQLLVGETGSPWEIDAKGVLIGGTSFVVVEGKRHTTKNIPQSIVASVAYTIQDTGPARTRSACRAAQSVRLLPFAGRLRRMREERRSAQRQNIGRRPRIDSDEAKLRVHHTQPLQRRSRCPMPNAGQPVDACGRERLPPRVGADHRAFARVSGRRTADDHV